jgi:hypothetical protein
MNNVGYIVLFKPGIFNAETVCLRYDNNKVTVKNEQFLSPLTIIEQ